LLLSGRITLVRCSTAVLTCGAGERRANRGRGFAALRTGRCSGVLTTRIGVVCLGFEGIRICCCAGLLIGRPRPRAVVLKKQHPLETKENEQRKNQHKPKEDTRRRGESEPTRHLPGGRGDGGGSTLGPASASPFTRASHRQQAHKSSAATSPSCEVPTITNGPVLPASITKPVERTIPTLRRADSGQIIKRGRRTRRE